MKQKAIAVLLTILFIMNMTIPVVAETDEVIIYENVTDSIVTQGVTKKNIVRFTNNGWLNINIIEADLTDRYLSVDLLTDSRGTNFMNNILKMAQENDAVAAINGDFFQRLRGAKDLGSAIGPVVKDGKLISTPAHEQGMAAMAVDQHENVFFDYWTYDVTITAPNGKTAAVKHMNKYDPLDSIVLYDRNWNTQSLGSDNNKVEVVVEKGIVREIRREMPPVEIPEDGYILCNLPEFDPFLIENFKVGDPVKLDIVTEPDFEDLKLAVGGGAVLVKDGKPVSLTHNIKGLHPRSAIGTDASGKKLFMITVDGRQLRSKGMTLEEMAQLLIELGIHDAINLDGGGSTALVSKSLGDDRLQVVNRASDGWLRNITNGIGIKSSAPEASIAGLVIETVSENVFVNTSRTFTVKAYDQYYNPVEVELDRVRWDCSGVEGEFKGNTFFPTSVGHGIVKATYRNVAATYSIDVLSAPASIEIQPKQLNMRTGDKIPVTITGRNRFGYGAPISVSDVAWSFSDDIAAVEGNGIKAFMSGVGVVTASVGDVNTHALIAVDFGTPVDNFEKLNGSFLPFPSYVEGSYALSEEQKRSGNYSGKLTFDFTAEHTESRAAYFKFNGDGIPINPKATKIGLWVHANKYMEHWLRGGIRDEENTFHRITFARKIDWDGWKYVEAELPQDIEGPIRLTRLYVVQIDPEIKNKGSVYFDDISFVFPENEIEDIQLPEDQRLPDELNKSTELLPGENNFRFSVFGNTIERRNLLENLIMTKTIDIFNRTTSLSAFVGNIDPNTLDGLTTKYLSTSGNYVFDFKGSTLMYMDNSDDGFRKTNPDQWIWFKETIDNIQNKNVFIFLPKPLMGENGFTDVYEAQLFKDILTEKLAKKGHNVFVFYNDEKTVCSMDRGVRYISTPGIGEIDPERIASLAEQYQYILVTVNGNEVSYEFKKIFP